CTLMSSISFVLPVVFFLSVHIKNTERPKASKAAPLYVNITCIITDDCILPCSFRPTGTVVIHWYKQQIPVHSYYYNKDQFGLQNKHFSGRTSLFNAQIPHGNASLLLRRVKVQDKGRYKCYTSTRKGNQEIFNGEVLCAFSLAPIISMIMEMTEETFTCSTHNTYPVPQVTWSTDPPSAEGSLYNSTISIMDNKGLFTVESTLRFLGNLSNYTYFCSFISADKSQVWTASWKKQDYIKQEEDRNFSLTWTFMSSSEPLVILRYDTNNRHIFNVWEDHAELDPEQLLLSNASLLLRKPNIEEHSGTYTCIISGLQSKHIIQTFWQVRARRRSVGEECALDLPSVAVEKPEDKPEDVEEKGRLVEKNVCGTSEPSKP
uniref:HERV-H LTR-associating 2a, tandem duplicate 2 n=1 Tax=Takifugu rubripes TaxID=31033 RepID=H2V2G2_TAKRU